jgi:Flp pilus assembly protein TadG
MRIKNEEGQAVVLVALAMSIFLIGAIGLGVDGSHLYSQRQMAQSAADAAAQAAMMSIFDGTNTQNLATTGFVTIGGTGFTCTTTDKRTPCVYARCQNDVSCKNGFGSTTPQDTVSVAFPPDSAAPGVTFASDTIHLVQVTVQRQVSTTLLRFLGPTATTVKASAMAAIVAVVSPTPILLTHPNLASALTIKGQTSTIKICGGPSRSIEINSSDPAAYDGGGTVDLRFAGTADTNGDCTKGTGADFGMFGGPTSNPGSVLLGSTGHYISPASPIQDPFAKVNPPNPPAAAPAPTTITTNGKDGCIAQPCTLYSPGLYTQLDLTGKNVLFKPGVYYIQGTQGFTAKQTTGGGTNNSSQCISATDCPADPNTGNGILIYDTGPSGSTFGNDPVGGFNLTTSNNILFQGPTITVTNAFGVNGCTLVAGCVVPTTPYYNLTMWEDRNADANHSNANSKPHQFGQGNGCIEIVGTIYITNTIAAMTADPTHYQEVHYGGTPCSTTVHQGDIITSQLELNGTAQITMDLVPYGFLTIRQVALVQ